MRNFEKIVKKNKYSAEEYATISKRNKKLNKPKRNKQVEYSE